MRRLKTLPQLKRSRSAITGLITKTLTITQPIMNKDKHEVTNQEIADLEVRQSLFEKKLSEAELLNAAILEQTPDTDEEVQDELITASEFHCKISLELRKIVKFLEQFNNSGPSLENANSAMVSNSSSNLKMPKFNLPSFDGQYQNWTPFFEQFMASVDGSTTLPDIQKFNYLKSSLVGEVSQLISYLPLSNTNYKIALKILIDHYDNQRLIVNTHLSAIFNLKPLQGESASELRKLIVAFEENLMAIQALKVDISSSDFVWVHVLTKKLDSESRRQFELDHPGKDLQTLQQLTDFINRRVRALEVSDPRTYRPKNDKANANTGRIPPKQNFQNSISQNYKATVEKCCVCSADHKIFNCDKFRALDFKAKKTLVFNSKLCFNCLQAGHLTKDCKSKSTCKVCNGKHNSLLHNENAITRSESTNTVVSGQAFTPSNIGILPTALVSIEDDSRQVIKCRALLDSGSQMSLISEEAVQRMKLKRHKHSLTVNGIGNVQRTYNSGKVRLRLSSNAGKMLEVQAFILPNLTQHLPNKSFKTTNWLHMKTVELADPYFNERKPIDMILGADVFEEILLDGSFKEEGGLHFRNSIFGWIASGKQPNQESSSLTTSLCINENFDLKKFWELEELPKACQFTDEELACEKHFQETTHIVKNRFEVSMPFKPDAQPLGDTYVQAKRRFLSLEKRLECNLSLKKGYTDFINEFISLNHLEPVPESEIDKPECQVNFLPHHCVHKEDSTTTKLRVVFDGSAKSTSGNSLNGSLMIGPTVQEDIFSILIRFRFHKVALSADIAKMYRQVALDQAGKDFHRILWRDSTSKPIQQNRMTRCTYGIASSAFHCTRAVKEVGDLCADKELGHSIKVDFYVDDYLSGANSITEAKLKVANVCEEMEKYGMQLRKWASSHHEITTELPEELRQSIDTSKIMHDDYKIKTLGISWKPNTDNFIFCTDFTEQHKLTKRELLSATAKLFDPIGWFGPIIVQFKILLQKLWVLGIKWDEILPPEIQERWNQMRADLRSLKDFTLQRCIVPPGKIQTVQLHLFTDASEKAYAAVIYARMTDTNGFVCVNLIAGKNRVAPIKTVSLPRLELCGAHLGVKLMVKIQEVLAITNLPQQEAFGWTDSTIVLHWLAQLPRTWTTFVANRVAEIQEILPRSNWNHVSSTNNPADCSSRGTTLELLQSSSLWWNGPQWLQQSQDSWPKTKLQQVEPIEVRGQNLKETPQSLSLTVTQSTLLFRPDQYSSLSKFIRVAATVLIAVGKFRGINRSSVITSNDLASAKWRILQEHQIEYYAVEYQTLKSAKKLSKQSRILNLTPFFDDESKTIRVGGRLSQGQFRELKKFPLLVSQDSLLAVLILHHFHEATLHGGAELTVNSSREEFWIPNASFGEKSYQTMHQM